MRLLRLQDDGTFSLVQRISDIPPYAILSHTWGPDGDEVTFEDLSKGQGQEKKGYEKLQFCARQATKDGLHFFWADTACIDKSSSAELSEAINSMFKWYRNAAKCYVYLSDVSSEALDTDRVLFHQSRWFTRGWTLQELLAPKVVEFYSVEGDLLGDKASRSQELAKITSISTEALMGNKALLEFSVEERMGWTVKRETTRAEDKAYCLLGIFNTFLPPIYGEGEENALKRLHKEMEDSRTIRDGQLRDIHQWLSPPDPSSNYQKALKQRQAGTGLWLLQCEQYTSWKGNAASWLWLYGIPGCGKTILSSTVLQNLQQDTSIRDQVVVYFYFDFKDAQKQSVDSMLRSLICQLSRQSCLVPDSLTTLCSFQKEGIKNPPADQLLSIMRGLVQELPQVYLVLDALDECDQRTELMESLKIVAGWKLQNLHITVTSRRERDIESTLGELVDSRNCVCLEADIVDEDIREYVLERLQASQGGLHKWGKDPALREEIESVLVKGSKGMFRWAVCQLDTLAKCRTRTSLKESLKSLPPTLDETYERILVSIPERDSAYALRLLQWLAFAERPLSPEELAEAAAIDITRDTAFDRDDVFEDPLDIVEICSSLVVLATDSNDERVVTLAHYSVKEFLVSPRIQHGKAKWYMMEQAACHSAIAQACLGYFYQFQDLEPMTNETFEAAKLALYAARSWSYHVRMGGNQAQEAIQAAVRFLTTETAAYLNCLRVWGYRRLKKELRLPLKDIMPPLNYAVLYNIPGVVDSLLKVGHNPNNWDEIQVEDAFHTACRMGNIQLVQMLLDAGADPNSQTPSPCTSALNIASNQGHEEIVSLLLKVGANLEERYVKVAGAHGNALYQASHYGYERIAKLLVEAGADVNTRSGDYGNALQVASVYGRERLIKLLLEAGADVNAQGGLCGNTLQAASYSGPERLIKLLLEAGADVNAQGGLYGSALHAASCSGNEPVAKLLVEAGADINMQIGRYGGALHAASCSGHERVVKLLIEAGAKVNAPNEKGNSALLFASLNGNEGTVKLLLEAGADVNAQGGQYGNALQAASTDDYERTVKLLLEAGADVNTQGGQYGNALRAASCDGSVGVVKILLDAGADVNAIVGKHDTAVRDALTRRDKQKVEILLRAGAKAPEGDEWEVLM